MDGPPFLLVESDTGLYWTPGGDILTEPALSYAASPSFIRAYLAYLVNLDGAAVQGLGMVCRKAFDYASGTLGGRDNPVRNSLATAVDAVGDWYAYNGNLAARAIDKATTPGRKVVEWIFG